MKKENKSVEVNNNENEEQMSFFKKMKTDKKYNAKVQLIGYGILIVFLIVYANITSAINIPSNSIIVDDFVDSKLDDNISNSNNDVSLLRSVDDNYKYDTVLEIEKKKTDDIEVSDNYKVRYFGKSFKNKLEITKEDSLSSLLYYKVDNRYYLKDGDDISLTEEDVIYDLISYDYIELDSIFNLIDKASLDYVTDYSSGKKEYLYHLKVKDVIVSYKLEDVVDISIVEENDILKINVDYSNLIKVVNDEFEKCSLEIVITDISKVEDFLVLDDVENTYEE